MGRLLDERGSPSCSGVPELAARIPSVRIAFLGRRIRGPGYAAGAPPPHPISGLEDVVSSSRVRTLAPTWPSLYVSCPQLPAERGNRIRLTRRPGGEAVGTPVFAYAECSCLNSRGCASLFPPWTGRGCRRARSGVLEDGGSPRPRGCGRERAAPITSNGFSSPSKPATGKRPDLPRARARGGDAADKPPTCQRGATQLASTRRLWTEPLAEDRLPTAQQPWRPRLAERSSAGLDDRHVLRVKRAFRKIARSSVRYGSAERSRRAVLDPRSYARTLFEANSAASTRRTLPRVRTCAAASPADPVTGAYGSRRR